MSAEQIRSAHIEEGRRYLRLAYGVVTDPQSSSVAYFSGQKEGRERAGQRQRPSTGGRHQVHATPTRAHGFSRPPLSDRQQLLGVVHRCISSLPPQQQTWVRFVYSQQGVDAAGQAFYRAYSAEFIERHLGACRVGTRSMVRDMVDFRMRQWRGWMPWSIQYQSEYRDLTPQEWKTFKPHWLVICGDLAEIDADALHAVGLEIAAALPDSAKKP